MTRSSTRSLAEWSVYQRGDSGAWCVSFKDGERWRDKRIPATEEISTKRAAEAWARDWIRERTAERLRPNAPTLGDYLRIWIERRVENPNVRRTTVSNNRGHIDRHIVPTLGARRVGDLTAEALREYVSELLKTETRNAKGQATGRIAPYTVRNVTATLRAALDEAIDDGYLDTNPMRSRAVRRVLPKPTTRAGRNVVIHLPKLEALRLLALGELPEDRRLRYLLGLLAGLRDGEIAALTWEDVAAEHEVPHLDVNKAFDTNWQMARPKTENGYRKVPLHPLVADALARWRAGGFVMVVGRPPRSTDPVLPNEKGKHHRPKAAELLREDLRAAGCATTYAGAPLEFRALRRSFATWLADAEVPDGLRKRLMGHGAAGVTDAHYTAKTLAALRGAVVRIELDVPPDGGGGGAGGQAARALMTDGVPADLPARAQEARAVTIAAPAQNLLPSPTEALGTLARPSVFKTDGASVNPGSGGFDSHALPLCRASPTCSLFTPRAT